MRKPAASSIGARAGTSAASAGETLSRRPCSAGRRPVRIDAWDGRVSGTCTVACSNSAPSRGDAVQPGRGHGRGSRSSPAGPRAGCRWSRARGCARWAAVAASSRRRRPMPTSARHEGQAAHERGILPGNEVDMGRMWVAGEWCDAADGRVFEVVNPATEEVLDTAPRAGAADVDRAVAAAARAFPEWRRTPGIERAEKLHHAARADPRGPRGPGHPAHEGGRQAAAREPRRGRVDRGLLRLLRGDRPRRRGPRHQPRWRRNQFNFVIKEPYGVGRADRALELPAAAAGLEAGPRPGRGQHGGGQAAASTRRSRPCA